VLQILSNEGMCVVSVGGSAVHGSLLLTMGTGHSNVGDCLHLLWFRPCRASQFS
jgi:hypothetical protein